jgi:hypothetical protein
MARSLQRAAAPVLAALALAVSTPARAQLGIGNILNPEGPRIFPQIVIYPRHPGKPDPRWRAFEWRSVDETVGSSHYRLYFYEGEDWSARFVVPRLREEIESLERSFDFSPPQRFNYLLFTSLHEFQQAHIFDISEGVQGITSTEEATMAIPYWGHAKVFEHISKHEMTHQFQTQKVAKLVGDNGNPEVGFAAFPLWFMEGMAEFYSYGGVDAETRQYVRDLLFYPNKKDDYEIPKFLDTGPMNFVGVYKLGQVKNAFLDSEFGRGTIQLVMRKTLRKKKDEDKAGFEPAILRVTKLKKEALEKRWRDYLDRTYKPEGERLSQSLDQYEELKEPGDTIDSFAVSPDGGAVITRTLDPMTGVTSLELFDLKDGWSRHRLAEDQEPGTMSLSFMENPILAVTDERIAYVVGTTSGPEVELRSLARDDDGKVRIGSPARAELHRFGFIQAHSPTFSPDGRRFAFVGLTLQGWDNVYVMDFADGRLVGKPRALTDDHYGWRDLSWGTTGIVGSCDRTPSGRYNLFRLDPDGPVNAPALQLSFADFDQLAPDAGGSRIVFQSWEAGSSQLYRLDPLGPEQLTEARTGVFSPRLRGDSIFALGFRSGRYHLYRIRDTAFLDRPATTEELRPYHTEAWRAVLADVPSGAVNSYHPFSTQNLRIDNIVGFVGSGAIGGLSADASDLMRNYAISAEFFALGSIRYTNAFLFLSSAKGRVSYTGGMYYVTQPRFDNLFTDSAVNTYLYREWGVLGVMQYPLTAFSYADFELRVGGVDRTDYSDPGLGVYWDALNPGVELLLAPMFRIGYDRILYEVYTGPLKGYGVLAEADTSWFPIRGAMAERLRLDAANYLKLPGRTVLQLQAMGGTTYAMGAAPAYRNPFFVSSDDLFRAYPFGDIRLYGNYLIGAKAELRFPIGSIFGFPPLRGLGSYDIGSIWSEPGQLGTNIASAATLGLTINFPPISLNFMSSYPTRVAPGPEQHSVLHFTLRYLYL